jgi:hypothetical protein
MARARFLHIGFQYHGVIDPASLTKTFDLAVDWMRYAPNCWLVYTTSEPATWYDRLFKVLPEPKKQHSIFIVEINIAQRSGQLNNEAWDWLQKSRS